MFGSGAKDCSICSPMGLPAQALKEAARAMVKLANKVGLLSNTVTDGGIVILQDSTARA